ncbi:MAG: transposase [Granulosicoccus sp.]|jgi:transposase
MQGEKPFAPKAFYQVNLDDLVRQDNFYRRLNQELDLRWIRKETKQYYGKEGQKSIDPVVFVKVLLVGYLNNLDSDRRLMEHCSNRLDLWPFLALTGPYRHPKTCISNLLAPNSENWKTVRKS